MRPIVVAAMVAVLALSGCTTTDVPASQATPSPTITATPTPTPVATATATPTVPPSPSPAAPEPTETAAGCDTVLTDAEYAALAADGLTLNPDIYVLDNEMQSLMDEGFGCYWTRSEGDVRVWYAQAEQDAAAWAARRQQLVDSGWTQTDTPIEGVLQASADHDANYLPAMVHLDGVTYYASYSDYFGSVKALLG